MKILLVNNIFYLKGGSETAFFNTAGLLEEKGHKVSFFSTKDRANTPSAYSKYFISASDFNTRSIREKIKFSSRMLYSFYARGKIEKLLKEERPDVAHLHNIYHQISPSILHSFKKFNIPVVMTLHDYKLSCASYLLVRGNKICELCKNRRYYWCFMTGCVKNSRVKSLLNTMEMYLHHKILNIYDLVNVFISPSRFLQNTLGRMGFKKDIAYLPHFMRADTCQPGYDHEKNYIVYLGRLSHEKGLVTLIDAVKDIKGVSLKIIGRGPAEGGLKEKVKSEGVKNVSFLGFRGKEDLKHEIRSAMFTVASSEWYENSPYSILESFCLGRPVIGSEIGGIPELVKNGETGLTFEAGNSSDLKEKIVHFLKNPDKIQEMGRRARQLIEENHSPERYYKGLIDIYKMAIEKR